MYEKEITASSVPDVLEDFFYLFHELLKVGAWLMDVCKILNLLAPLFCEIDGDIDYQCLLLFLNYFNLEFSLSMQLFRAIRLDFLLVKL